MNNDEKIIKKALGLFSHFSELIVRDSVSSINKEKLRYYRKMTEQLKSINLSSISSPLSPRK